MRLSGNRRAQSAGQRIPPPLRSPDGEGVVCWMISWRKAIRGAWGGLVIF